MIVRRKATLVLAAVLAVSCVALAGCNSGENKATAEETTAFKGSAPPPGARERWLQNAQAAQQGGNAAAQKAREQALQQHGGGQTGAPQPGSGGPP